MRRRPEVGGHPGGAIPASLAGRIGGGKCVTVGRRPPVSRLVSRRRIAPLRGACAAVLLLRRRKKISWSGRPSITGLSLGSKAQLCYSACKATNVKLPNFFFTGNGVVSHGSRLVSERFSAVHDMTGAFYIYFFQTFETDQARRNLCPILSVRCTMRT